VTRQGAVAHWLYIVITGEAEVVVDQPDGKRRTLNRLSPGTCFGERGLLTGEPRTATVIANTDIECYRLDKASLDDILRLRPALAEDFSHMLQAQQMAADQKLQQADADELARRAASERSEILSRIRNFFGLNHA
jgi:CRP-like cAMP-binding protein